MFKLKILQTAQHIWWKLSAIR